MAIQKSLQRICAIGCAVMTFFLAGCTSEWRAQHILANGWVGPTSQALEQKIKPLYCYQTLGQPECYSSKQEGMENRLVGYYLPLSRD